VAWALVVIGESVRGRADRALAGGDLDHLEPGRGRPRRIGHRSASGKLVTPQAREHQRLQHRLVVLLLVADHHLVQDAVADAALVDHLERSGANVLQVLTGLRRSQQRKVTPDRARRFERVVHRREVLAQERPVAETMHQP
jgi:hypothetical protein